NRVMSALQSGQLKTAHSGARTLTRSHPKEASFHNLEGLILARMGKERQAIPCFQKAIKLDPSFAESHKNLAQALFVLGMHDKAQTLMVRHLKTQPKDSDALYLLAMSQTRTSDLNAAEATATRAIAAGGN